VIRTIAGRQNDSVKLAKKLQRKNFRRDRGLFVAEGLDLLSAAFAVGEPPVELLVRDDLFDRLPAELVTQAREDELDIGICTADVLAHASSLGGAADVVAVFETIDWALGDLAMDSGITVYLAGLGDPGNVGTVVRSAVAFGAIGVVCGMGTADPFGPKALRAGMGAQFLTRIVTDVSTEDLSARLQAERRRGSTIPEVVLADPSGETEATEYVRGRGDRGASLDPVLLVLGGERHGLPEFTGAAHRIQVAQAGFDSLNVAMAGTILLYLLARPRLGKAREGLLA
jgi:TrmH family RNA methyltransferase